jgi:type IV secretion system protein VirB9
MKKGFLFIVILVVAIGTTSTAFSAVPITTDSRIKTFVYNQNEVFYVTVHYGFMTSIEFANNEDILTIAPGNGYSWKFIKEGRRLFIKALEGAAKTNVTIITTKRTYQFELESKNPSDGLDDQLVYVVRFFYPEEMLDQPRPKVDTERFAPTSVAAPPQAPLETEVFSPTAPARPVVEASPFPSASTPLAEKRYNFNYTLTGPENIAPLKVFDDGKSTFLQLPNNNAVIPHFFVISPDGKETPISYTIKGEYLLLAAVAPRIILRLGQDEVTIFNEQYK